MKRRKILGTVLPGFHVKNGWEFGGTSIGGGNVEKMLDDLSVFTRPACKVSSETTGDRLVDKPTPYMSFVLDRDTRTMHLMDRFADMINAHQNWLEIKFRDRIRIHSGRVPAFEVISVLFGSVNTMDAPAGLLSMSDLRVRDEDDGRYWKFVLHIAKELGAVWREIPLGKFYFNFKDQYVLKAKNTTELYTMQAGDAGCY